MSQQIPPLGRQRDALGANVSRADLIIAVYADDYRLLAAIDRAMEEWGNTGEYSRKQVAAAFLRWLPAAVDALLDDAEAYATGGELAGFASSEFTCGEPVGPDAGGGL